MPIFSRRENYKPFVYQHITDHFIYAMWATHWTHREFTFNSDIQDFKTRLSPKEQEMFKRTMLLISQIEVAVKTYWTSLGRIFPQPEIGDMGAVFGGVEVIHSRAYAEILNKLGFNDEFQDILNKPVVRNRVAYLNKYNNTPYENDHKNAIYSLTLFTLFVENVSLFTQFYTVLALNKFRGGILKDVANVVQYTSKEENLHAEGGIALINTAREEYPEIFDEEFKNRILNESQEALKAEINLIDWILDGYHSEFLSKDILVTYLKRRLNESLEKIGFGKPFEIDPELEDKTFWMDDEVYTPALTDFFYKKPIDYAKKVKSFDVSDLF